MPRDQFQQTIFGRFSHLKSQDRRHNCRAAAHSAATGDERFDFTLHKATRGFDGSPQQPVGIAGSIDERETAIDDFATELSGWLVHCQIDYY